MRMGTTMGWQMDRDEAHKDGRGYLRHCRLVVGCIGKRLETCCEPLLSEHVHVILLALVVMACKSRQGPPAGPKFGSHWPCRWPCSTCPVVLCWWGQQTAVGGRESVTACDRATGPLKHPAHGTGATS